MQLPTRQKIVYTSGRLYQSLRGKRKGGHPERQLKASIDVYRKTDLEEVQYIGDQMQDESIQTEASSSMKKRQMLQRERNPAVGKGQVIKFALYNDTRTQRFRIHSLSKRQQDASANPTWSSEINEYDISPRPASREERPFGVFFFVFFL